MQVVLIACAAVVSPMLGLALLLWLAHLEDTLPQDVQRAGRTADPAPILAIPVRRAPTMPVLIPAQVPAARVPTQVPAQRTAPAVELAVERAIELAGGSRAQPEPTAQAFSRSTSDSLGGSTNR